MGPLSSLYLRRRFFTVLGGCALLFILGYFLPFLIGIALVSVLVLALTLVLDVVLLYRVPEGLRAHRLAPERFSNGDANEIRLHVANHYPFPMQVTLLDELPFQLQVRDAVHQLVVPSGKERTVRYRVRPVQRGCYAFGAFNVYGATPLGLAERRYRFDEGCEVAVYPSFLQMRRFELLAISNRLGEIGVKKVRRVGRTMEFDQIRAYVRGDDPRTLNWKATARRGDLMVNQYQDERAQPVYCLLDTGRVMQMPFEGMTLLDYSINASLVLSNIALLKQDRAGVITFSRTVDRVLPAERRSGQIFKIQELLYNLDTDFSESDYARLVVHLRRRLRQRSLLLLFTNFETRTSLRRQLPYLRALAQKHVVVAIFFENTTLHTLLTTTPADIEGLYVKTLARKFEVEKREIVKDLRRYGIHAILTPPEELSVNTINTYLSLKARGTI